MKQDVNKIMRIVNEKWAISQMDLVTEIAFLTEELERVKAENERLKKELDEDKAEVSEAE